jgi:crotonobetainyl-CoA:carnitine CoA-transferase CaiB-like acyl-CoA transferase
MAPFSGDSLTPRKWVYDLAGRCLTFCDLTSDVIHVERPDLLDDVVDGLARHDARLGKYAEWVISGRRSSE